jgi:hypothetical protein
VVEVEILDDDDWKRTRAWREQHIIEYILQEVEAITVIQTSCALLPRSIARDWRPVLSRTQNLPLEWRSRGTTALRAVKFKASDQTFNLWSGGIEYIDIILAAGSW